VFGRYIILTSRIKEESRNRVWRKRRSTEYNFFPFFFFPEGIGIQEILLTSGCPGDEAKCIVGVKECHGPVDCGCEWNTVMQ